MFLSRLKSSKIFSIIAGILVCGMALPPSSWAGTLSAPSALSPALNLSIHPVVIRGIKISPEDPFHLDFLVDSGDFVGAHGRVPLQKETERLIKYFLAGLTIRDQDLWVNLSPEEPDRIIPDALSQTDLGRDLLSQDYVLKQLTASLLNPDSETGKMFWTRIHETAYESGVTEISADILKKIWIVPDFADVVVLPNGAYVESARLKVMVEENDCDVVGAGLRACPREGDHRGSPLRMKDVLTRTILPAIEKEVNEGEAFAPLRQIYHSLILASWFKNHSAKSILGSSYIGQSKVDGIETFDTEHKQRTYQQYLDAFRRGAADVIREEYDPETQNVIPRHYFTGGIPMGNVKEASMEKPASQDFAMLLNGQGFQASVQAEPAMLADSFIRRMESRRSGLLTVERHEMVRDISDPFDPDDENTANYIANQNDVRQGFYDLMIDIALGKLDEPEAMAKRISDLHKVLITGKDGKTIYIPPTAKVLPSQTKEEWALENAGIFLGYTRDIRQIESTGFEIFRYFDGILSKLRDFFVAENEIAALKRIINFYLFAMFGPENSFLLEQHELLFNRGNNSFWMNAVNLMLKIYGFHGMPHGNLDTNLPEMLFESYQDDQDEFRDLFLRQLASVDQSEDSSLAIDILRQELGLTVDAAANVNAAMMVDVMAKLIAAVVQFKNGRNRRAPYAPRDSEVENFIKQKHKAFWRLSLTRLNGVTQQETFREIERMLDNKDIDPGQSFAFNADMKDVLKFMRHHVQGLDVKTFSIHHSRVNSNEWLITKGGIDVHGRERDTPLKISIDNTILFDWHFYVRPAPQPAGGGVWERFSRMIYRDIIADIFFDSMMPSQLFIVTPEGLLGLETENAQKQKFSEKDLNRGNVLSGIIGADKFLRKITGIQNREEISAYLLEHDLITLEKMDWHGMTPKNFQRHIDKNQGDRQLNIFRQAKLWKMIIREKILSRRMEIENIFSEMHGAFDQWENQFAVSSLENLVKFMAADMATDQMLSPIQSNGKLPQVEGGEWREYQGVNETLRGVWFEAKSPNAPVVVFMPPLGGYSVKYHELVDTYRTLTDAHVLLMDPHGYGRSGGKIRKMGVGDDKDLKLVIKKIKADYSKSNIMLHGISIGAIIMSQMVSRNSELVQGLFVQSVTPDFRQSFKRLMAGYLKNAGRNF